VGPELAVTGAVLTDVTVIPNPFFWQISFFSGKLRKRLAERDLRGQKNLQKIVGVNHFKNSPHN
jgi:hypothetical protein